MADIVSDGFTRVSHFPSCANTSSPTTTELNAGIQLQAVLTADGLVGFEVSTQPVDTQALNSLFATNTIGRDQASGTMFRFKKQTATDTTFNTITRGTAGFVAIRRSIAETTAWASSQALQVYAVIYGNTRFLNPEANSLEKWEVDVFFTATPVMRASVA